MKCCVAALLGSSLAIGQNTPDMARPLYLYSDLRNGSAPGSAESTVALPKAFVPALKEVKAKSSVAVLLPSELPQPFKDAKHAIVEKALKDGYAISLYYDLDVGDAGFAASFMADAHSTYEPRELGNVRKVKLRRGLIGYFSPVSCGGSCAPANLWWKEDQILYQLQLRLSPTLPEKDQQEMTTMTADSAILAGPR